MFVTGQPFSAKSNICRRGLENCFGTGFCTFLCTLRDLWTNKLVAGKESGMYGHALLIEGNWTSTPITDLNEKCMSAVGEIVLGYI